MHIQIDNICVTFNGITRKCMEAWQASRNIYTQVVRGS